jgi:hypothetical protein
MTHRVSFQLHEGAIPALRRTKSIVNPSELSNDELVQLWTYFSIAQITAMQSFVDYDEGRISEQAWLYSLENFVSHFNYPMGRVWFEETKRSYAGSESRAFFDAVQESLDSTPEDQVSEWLNRMRERARALKVTPGS